MNPSTAGGDTVAAPLVLPKPRLAMIDIAKGVGILLIVIGHNAIFSANYGWLADFLKSFRLPFFFFISGTTFAMGARSIGTVAFERADAWLKPCAVVVVGIGLIRVALHIGSLENIFLGLAYGTGFTLMWTPTWFLPHLWLLYMFAAVLLTHGRFLVDNWPKRAVLLTAMATAGFLLMRQFDRGDLNPACVRIMEFGPSLFDCGLPFSADILLLTATFFLMGNFLSTKVKQFKPDWRLLLATAGLMLALDYLFGFKIDFNQRRYDDLVVSSLQAFCGIYVMLCLCSLLSRSSLATRLLSYLGRGSLFILIFHATVMYKLTDILPRFIHAQWAVALIGMVAAIGISLLMWELCKRNKYTAMLMLPIKRRKNAAKIEAQPVRA